jgi:hypothetical protein
MSELKQKGRPTQITMDLLGYKQPWLDWCKSQGVTPSEAFRRVVARLVAAKSKDAVTDQALAAIVIGEPQKPTARKEITLTASEMAHVEALAAAEGFSATKWIVALIRARLTGTGQYGQRELELLAQSNLQLLAIGRNLNQVARALNSTPQDRTVYRIALIDALRAHIKAHTKLVSNAMAANVHRWRIK